MCDMTHSYVRRDSCIEAEQIKFLHNMVQTVVSRPLRVCICKSVCYTMVTFDTALVGLFLQQRPDNLGSRDMKCSAGKIELLYD